VLNEASRTPSLTPEVPGGLRKGLGIYLIISKSSFGVFDFPKSFIKNSLSTLANLGFLEFVDEFSGKSITNTNENTFKKDLVNK